MFDGLRNDAEESSGFDEGQIEFFPQDQPAARARSRSSGKLLGMNSQQRFFVAIMLMFATLVMGAMCLLLTGRLVLPI